MTGGQQLVLIVVLAALLIAGGMFILAQVGRIEARKFIVGASLALVVAAAVVAFTAFHSQTEKQQLSSNRRTR
jgi:hypothetical protein